jgi:DNA-binding MarR family transcriptional regulator
MTRVNLEDYHALAQFRYLLRKFLRFSKDVLSHTGRVTPEQYEALLAIKAFTSPAGLTITQLSERLQVKHHSAVNIVDRLVERKLITREAAKTDRRRRHVKITARGDKLIEQLAAVHWKEMRTCSPEMIKALERFKK